MDAQKRKERVAGLSVISNAVLVALKLAAGLMIGSVSIISEALHSGVDLLAAIIALFSVKTSCIPADTKHPFGHGKVENISGTIEALLIFAASGWILFEAVEKLRHPQAIEYAGWGVTVMLVSAAANLIVSRMLFQGRPGNGFHCPPGGCLAPPDGRLHLHRCHGEPGDHLDRSPINARPNMFTGSIRLPPSAWPS